MVYLVVIGSSFVNGVLKFYIEILKNEVLKCFYIIYFEKFNSKINGIIYRRWFVEVNLDLVRFIFEIL